MARPKIDFSRSRRVPLEAPPEPVARPKARKKSATAVAEMPVKASAGKKSSVVVKEKNTPVVAVRPMPSGRVMTALTSILGRASVGEFRGRKEKPAIQFTKEEMTALQQCLTTVTPTVEPSVSGTSSEKSDKRKKRSRVA